MRSLPCTLCQLLLRNLRVSIAVALAPCGRGCCIYKACTTPSCQPYLLLLLRLLLSAAAVAGLLDQLFACCRAALRLLTTTPSKLNTMPNASCGCCSSMAGNSCNNKPSVLQRHVCAFLHM